MKVAKKIPIDELREHLLYDSLTGVFTRKRQIKRPLGFVNDRGYLIIEWKDSPYRAHRIAWVWMYGESNFEIDHINGIRLDNRIINLREATRSGNNINKDKTIKNTSGYKGVSFFNTERVWRARIGVDNKQFHLGYFSTKEEANEARRKAAIKYHGDFDYFTSQAKSTQQIEPQILSSY